MLSTNKHVDTDFIKINVNNNRSERVLSVIVDEKQTWNESCK